MNQLHGNPTVPGETSPYNTNNPAMDQPAEVRKSYNQQTPESKRLQDNDDYYSNEKFEEPTAQKEKKGAIESEQFDEYDQLE